MLIMAPRAKVCMCMPLCLCLCLCMRRVLMRLVITLEAQLIGLQHRPSKLPDLGLLDQSILGLCYPRLLYLIDEVDLTF